MNKVRVRTATALAIDLAAVSGTVSAATAADTGPYGRTFVPM